MRDSRTAAMLRSALAAALVSVSAAISIPIGPVPVTLQLLALAVIVLLLSPGEVFAATVLYVAIGAIGLPVFSGASGGVGVLLGPTGGFLLGFVAGAPAGAWMRRRVRSWLPGRPMLADVAGVSSLVVIAYGLGWARLAAVTGMDAAAAFGVAVAPFLLSDALKVAGAIAVARAARHAGLEDRSTDDGTAASV